MLPRDEVVALLSAATVFACPSVYEPLGIVNLEAMACELPVVATATGGIPEVVVDGETGWLVPIEQVEDGTGTPVDPDAFVADLAGRLTEAVSDPERAKHMGLAGRLAPWSPSRGRASATRPWRSTARCSAQRCPPGLAAGSAAVRRAQTGRQPASSMTARLVAPARTRSATRCSERRPASRRPDE